MTTVRLGTRGSALAVTQSRWVARLIAERAREEGLDLTVELVEITTRGDTDPTALAALGGVGVFAAALRTALLAGECDLAVHSYKDLPTAPTPGLMIAAVPEREDPRDALCVSPRLLSPTQAAPTVSDAGEPGCGVCHDSPDGNLAALDLLPRGARVGTGSPRRGAQLLALRPDLEIVPIRGNVPTRLARVVGSVVSTDGPMGATREPDLDAVVLAYAGMKRLGLEAYASLTFDPTHMFPAAAQGALAVETRDDLQGTLPELAVTLARLDDPLTRACADAERALMRELGAGCAAPVGALATPALPTAEGGRACEGADAVGAGEGEIALEAAVVALDGARSQRVRVSGASRRAEALGQEAARRLVEAGAANLTDLHASKKGHAHPAPLREQA